MQRKTRYKSQLVDLFVVTGCLFVFVSSLVLFWKDLNSSSVRTDKKQIATIVFKQRIAQRKFSDRVVWERLKETSPLYNEDTIRTADLAQATITFIDGTKVELNENSMLQVFYTEEGVKVNIDGGNVSVDTSKASGESGAVAVHFKNGSVVNMESGSRLSAKSEKDGSSNLQFQQGSGNILDEKGQVMLVDSGEALKLSESGSIKKEDISVVSIPKNFTVLNFDADSRKLIHLEWAFSKEYKDSPVVVETSLTRDFSKLLNTYNVSGANSIDVPAVKGTMYWRVYVKGHKDISADGKVRTEEVLPVVAVSPKNASEFSYRTTLPSVIFSWTGNDFAEKYRLDISKDRGFKDILVSKQTSQKSLNIHNLQEGSYFWRVVPYYSVNDTGYGEASGVQSFTIIKKQKLEKPNPVLPVNDSKIIYETKNYEIPFSWKSDVKSASYKIEVSDSKDFSRVQEVFETEALRYRAKVSTDQIGDGKWYWRVIRSSEEDEEPSVSAVRSFNVEKYVPGTNRLVYPPENFQIEQSKLSSLEFLWKLSDEYKNQNVKCVIEISRNEDFNNTVFVSETDGVSFNRLNISNGVYYWRVGVKAETQEKTYYTQARKISVLKELSSPAILSPSLNQIINVKEFYNLPVKWNSVSGADYYKVRVYEADSGKLVKEVLDVRASYVQVPLNFEKYSEIKRFKVQVQPFTEESELSAVRTGKVSEVIFAVRTPDSVQLTSPADKKQFTGLDAMKTPVELSWKSGKDKPVSVTLVLQKMSPDGNFKTVETYKNPHQQVSVERLSTGTYRWYVEALTQDGIDISSDVKNIFSVGNVPLLNNPVFDEPSNGMKITGEYLKNNRAINFKWKAVPYATDYTFSLYKKDSDGSFKRIYLAEKLKENELKFTKLNLLDVGDFECRVQAYAHSKDGYEEQKSLLVSNNFKIDFKKPGKVKTIDPGKQYGN